MATLRAVMDDVVASIAGARWSYGSRSTGTGIVGERVRPETEAVSVSWEMVVVLRDCSFEREKEVEGEFAD